MKRTVLAFAIIIAVSCVASRTAFVVNPDLSVTKETIFDAGEIPQFIRTVTLDTNTTFQAAYNAANDLQIVLSKPVAIMVGVVSAGEMGDCVITNDWNANVSIIGTSKDISNLGYIYATNNILNSWNVDVRIENVSLSGVYTKIEGTSEGIGSTSGYIRVKGNNAYCGLLSTLADGANDTLMGNITVGDNMHCGNISCVSVSPIASYGILTIGNNCIVGDIAVGVKPSTDGYTIFIGTNNIIGNIAGDASLSANDSGCNVFVGNNNRIGTIDLDEGNTYQGTITAGDNNILGNIASVGALIAKTSAIGNNSVVGNITMACANSLTLTIGYNCRVGIIDCTGSTSSDTLTIGAGTIVNGAITMGADPTAFTMGLGSMVLGATTNGSSEGVPFIVTQ